MNKKGQVWAYAMMLSLTIVVLALALAPAGQSVIDDTLNATVGDTLGLDCANVNISNFQKGTCVIADFSSAYFFGGLIFIGLAVLTARITLGGGQ